MSGRIPGRRFASIDLPEPGGPMSRILCPPAAAISSARLAVRCPRTSEKSSGIVAMPARNSSGSKTVGAIVCVPARWASSSDTDETPSTVTPETTDASSAFSRGTYTVVRPASRAASTIGSTPRTGRSSPESDSSPMNVQAERSHPRGSPPLTARMLTRIARSNADPSFLIFAGARLIVSSMAGKRMPLFSQALRTRSFASLTAASGSPTSSKFGRRSNPLHSTVTSYPSTPSTPAEKT